MAAALDALIAAGVLPVTTTTTLPLTVTTVTTTTTTTTTLPTTTTTLPVQVAAPPIFFLAAGDTDTRTTAPRTNFSLAGGTGSQIVNPDGSLTFSYADCLTYCDVGAYWLIGALGDLTSITLTTDATLGANLWFDTGGDGTWFAWNPDGTFSGLNGDDYGFTPGTTDGTLTIDGTTPIFMTTGQTGTYTVAQLKAGAFPGVDASTLTALWIGVCCGPGSNQATVTSLSINP